MATPVPAAAASPNPGMPNQTHPPTSPMPQQWQQPSKSGGELRSVTPAMNNTRGAALNGPAPVYPTRVPSPTPNQSAMASQNGVQQSTVGSHYGNRAMSPSQRYGGSSFDVGSGSYPHQQPQSSGPSSTGLIRLTLRKPMGIVFEPMYDPNQPSVQRGVRICDLPRTGAAALSHRLEIGDELLSINDKTMSRLTFDEIMDFIIEADPEQVNLLFRRPRKEVLAARNAMKSPAINTASVKWVDEDGKQGKKEKQSSRKSKDQSSKSKKSSNHRSDDETLETYEETDRRRRKSRKKDPYENESFLDLLIDTICANPDTVCRSDRRREEEDYYSDEEEDDRTFTSYDDSTYLTYESEKNDKPKGKSSSKNRVDDEDEYTETEDDTLTEDDRRRRKIDTKSKTKDDPLKTSKYEDDETLETAETNDRPKASATAKVPLGLAPAAEHTVRDVALPTQELKEAALPSNTGAPEPDEANKAPISELEYDDQIDHGADVSVMESLGGPSLLIEKQRQAQALAKANEDSVPADIINEFGPDYPAEYGLTREQTIRKDPIKFYTFVVKGLLEEHEPEKVRLLDKLLAKYKGREDHLVQKLSVRYNRGDNAEEDNKAFGEFTDAVNKNKDSVNAERAVQKAQERAAATFGTWPDKETKEQEPEEDEEESDDESEYSGDSIDGTSPAVIAQVSELLNYVYGKTSVPGQIDRVSTIMRAYEGREAVLLELLETKALIKANSEKENAANLPTFLRNSPALQNAVENDARGIDGEVVSPLSSPHVQNQQGNIINDDISSMSGVSSPIPNSGTQKTNDQTAQKSSVKERSASLSNDVKKSSTPMPPPSSKSTDKEESTPARSERKKKGLFGGLFKKNRKGKDGRIRKGGKDNVSHGEGSI